MMYFAILITNDHYEIVITQNYNSSRNYNEFTEFQCNIFWIEFLFAEIQARQDSSANTVELAKQKIGYKGQEDVPGMVKDVLAQKGGTAYLPCKLDTGAGIVSFYQKKKTNFSQL